MRPLLGQFLHILSDGFSVDTHDQTVVVQLHPVGVVQVDLLDKSTTALFFDLRIQVTSVGSITGVDRVRELEGIVHAHVTGRRHLEPYGRVLVLAPVGTGVLLVLVEVVVGAGRFGRTVGGFLGRPAVPQRMRIVAKCLVQVIGNVGTTMCGQTFPVARR
ncbi:hypothetical protein ADK86_04025 [Streptomyces sp. NRRL F-5755]|nr:hypothetical protein ADK86_04025 [Streptomyces sp. NRRL F-5755]